MPTLTLTRFTTGLVLPTDTLTGAMLLMNASCGGGGAVFSRWFLSITFSSTVVALLDAVGSVFPGTTDVAVNVIVQSCSGT